jgi:hypothetical protein
VFPWPLFPLTVATKAIFRFPELLRIGLHGDVLAAQKGWMAVATRQSRVMQTSRFSALLVLTRDTRVNNHPEGKNHG